MSEKSQFFLYEKADKTTAKYIIKKWILLAKKRYRKNVPYLGQ